MIQTHVQLSFSPNFISAQKHLKGQNIETIVSILMCHPKGK